METLVRVEELRKSFPSGHDRLEVLRRLDLDVAEGEFVTVIGQSGAGKSTLLHLIGGLDRPDGGGVYYRGRDIFAGRQTDLDRYRNREVGFVFQFHHLLPEFTALENVMMPALTAFMRIGAARDAARRLLTEVGLADRADHRPGQLSGGEQQRVAVARALVMEPFLLLADEPTGNLDAENSARVFELIRQINARRRLTVIMVTHNVDLAKAADRTYMLNEGKLQRRTAG